MKCPECRIEIPEDSKFCKECGQRLVKSPNTVDNGLAMEAERKHVTIMFSDLSGYTAMTETLDPEEVNEIMGLIFGKITEIIHSYDGFIERFIGDAVMAVFGVPEAHEDDPIRAIRAAMEIHAAIESFSPRFEGKIGRPLTMHTGINTGLVVTGEVDVEKGTYGLTGDAINLASRLEGIAKAGEIVVGPDTYKQAMNSFEFKTLEPNKVKGKQKPLSIYSVKSGKKGAFKTHRLQGLRAALIGRDKEMAILAGATDRLKQGQGSIISISGDAGTGKSRLKREFKDTLDLNAIQWREGHAYSYSQNAPYSPLINLLTNAFQIDEGDLPDRIRSKVEFGVTFLLGENSKVVPYIGSLFSLTYKEVEDISPEYWKEKMQESIQSILAALINKGPTIVCFEDLHWADPSFIELLRRLLGVSSQKALFICTYRPSFSLFDRDLPDGMKDFYHTIRLKDLEVQDGIEMLKSLLDVQDIPVELYDIVRQKAEGNPFYIEEIINSLIESEVLNRDSGDWKLARKITEDDIPTTIQGLLTARIDRLGNSFKRILKEASVIGRVFPVQLLKRITDLKEHIDPWLSALEQIDLIKKRGVQTDVEYVFKHALIQEVVYNGILKKERREIHGRIASVMEQMFEKRLSEFFEILAFHFTQARALHKAVEYLLKSGEKNLNKYAIKESHKYFRTAFELLTEKPDRSKEEDALLIEVLTKWSYAFVYSGQPVGMADLLWKHEDLARSLSNKITLGMFYVWLGTAYFGMEKCREAYKYLKIALLIGEETRNKRVIGYACAQLGWICAEMGKLDEAIIQGKKAQQICQVFKSDQYLFFNTHTGIGQAYWYMGEREKALDIGKTLLSHAETHSNTRCFVGAYYVIGWSHFTAGDFSSAIESFRRSIKISIDPYYSQFPKLGLAYSYLSDSQFPEAEKTLEEIMDFSRKYALGLLQSPAGGLQGLVSIANGDLSRGMSILQDMRKLWLENHRRSLYVASEYMLGKVYLQIMKSARPVGFSNILKNIGFLIRAFPNAARRSEDHLLKAIKYAKEIGAMSILGQASLDLGLLHRAKGREEQAKKWIIEATRVFENCKAEVYLKQASEALVAPK